MSETGNLSSEGFSEAEMPRHLERIRVLPCVETTDLMHAAFYTGGQHQEIDVPVERIVAAQNIPSWDKIDRFGSKYLAEMIKAIHNDTLDLKKQRPELLEWGGAFAVLSDGNTRCGVAKMMGLPSIPAQVVVGVQLEGLSVFSEDDYRVLLERRERGLWTGSLDIKPGGGGFSNFYAAGKVQEYEGL